MPDVPHENHKVCGCKRYLPPCVECFEYLTPVARPHNVSRNFRMRDTPVIQNRAPLERKKTILDEAAGADRGRRHSIEQLSKASPFGQMLESVKKLATSKGLWDDELQRDLPKKWEKHGDMIVFPQNSFTHNNWRYIGRELWKVVAESLNIRRLGRKRLIGDDTDRTPHVDILFGDNGWVEYVDDRGIRFSYDASKRVFNNAKTKEMSRIAQWDCHGETVVDMYAGLGYYTFPFLKCCHAKKVIAIDWDEDMVECLLRTGAVNEVADRLEVLQGDTRRITPMGVADRVYLGLIPSCRAHWLTACKALKEEGGVIHIHDTIEIGKKKLPRKEPLKRLPLKLPSVDEEGSSGKENKKTDRPEVPATSSTTDSSTVEGVPEGEESKEPVKRKFSRSASIVEEMESRVFPEPKVLKEYEQGGWAKLDKIYKEYAIDCATNCTRFLNNIHLSDNMYCVTILNITRYGTSCAKSDHVVLDLLCCLESAPVEKLAAQFMNTNLNV